MLTSSTPLPLAPVPLHPALSLQIQRVYEVTKRNKNDIALALEFYEYDVQKTIQAFIEGESRDVSSLLVAPLRPARTCLQLGSCEVATLISFFY